MLGLLVILQVAWSLECIVANVGAARNIAAEVTATTLRVLGAFVAVDVTPTFEHQVLVMDVGVG